MSLNNISPHEIVFITAHTPDEVTNGLLRDLVKSLKYHNKKIIVCSHTGIDQDILDLIDYFIYDSNNQLIIYNEPEGWTKTTCTSSSQIIVTKDSLYIGSSVLAHWRLLSNGLSLCKSLGYKYVHYFEFDSQISNIIELDNNTQLLAKGNANVVYTFPEDIQDPKPYFNLKAHYNAWNLDYYSREELAFDEIKIRQILQQNKGCSEWSYYDFFIKDKPHVIKNQHDLSSKGVILDLHHNTWGMLNSKGLIEPSIYVLNNNLEWYFDNSTNKNIILTFIVNASSEEGSPIEYSYEILPYHWRSNVLDHLDSIDTLTVYINGKFLREIILKEPLQKETFKQNNYLLEL